MSLLKNKRLYIFEVVVARRAVGIGRKRTIPDGTSLIKPTLASVSELTLRPKFSCPTVKTAVQDLTVSPRVDRSEQLVCPISLIAEGQATNSLASLRIVTNGGMSYVTERLIHNTRVQKDVFLSVNNIPVDHIRFYGNRSTVVIISAPSREDDNRYRRCVILCARNGEAVIFKSPFFDVNLVVGCVN